MEMILLLGCLLTFKQGTITEIESTEIVFETTDGNIWAMEQNNGNLKVGDSVNVIFQNNGNDIVEDDIIIYVGR